MTVEKLVYGGDGLARLDGRVVFAPFVLPGERVRVEPESEKPGMVRARTLDILQAAPDRVTPPCPYFGHCGGCHYQHAPYATQLAAKKSILEEALRRQGKMEPPTEIAVMAGEPWGYRNRVQLHVSEESLGYREARSHKLCAVTSCPIASPTLNRLIVKLTAMVRDRRWPRFLRTIEIFTDEEQVQLNVIEAAQPVAKRFFEWCAEEIEGLVPAALDYQGRFRVSRNSFFQVNRFLLDRLVETATGGARGETALDLYAGVGLFTLALGKSFSHVTAVESNSSAARDLEFNAARAGHPNVHTVRGAAESYLETLDAPPDFVLLDPPRAGLGKTVVRRLAELRPRVLSIVSCDPATLARDLPALHAAGYCIEQMTLVDLFPQTYHLETVARLALA